MMKLKDIEVGKEYSYGSETYPGRCRVLEVGIHGRRFDGHRHVQSIRADYVRIKPVHYREKDVPARQIFRLWSEQELVNATNRERRERRAERDAAKRRLRDAAPEMLEALKACEENLRLLHGATGPGPVSKDSPMPSHSTFGAWKLASDMIARAEGGTDG